jgi:hypothetical protein
MYKYFTFKYNRKNDGNSEGSENGYVTRRPLKTVHDKFTDL